MSELPTSVVLRRALREAVDRLALARGWSRSEAIRRLIVAGLAELATDERFDLHEGHA